MLRLRRLVSLAGLLPLATAAPAATPYKIVTACERGTYIEIRRDLAKFVAPICARRPALVGPTS